MPKHINVPGVVRVLLGAIRIDHVEQVFDQPNFKVWEITLKSRYAQTHITHTSGKYDFEGWEVNFTESDYTMYSNSKKDGRPTAFQLDLDPDKRWQVSVSGGKSDYTIIAYSRPPIRNKK